MKDIPAVSRGGTSFLTPTSPRGKEPTPLSGLHTQRLSLCVLFSCKNCDTLTVPEGHHPRSTAFREANLPLKGVLRSLCGGLFAAAAGLCRLHGIFRG